MVLARAGCGNEAPPARFNWVPGGRGVGAGLNPCGERAQHTGLAGRLPPPVISQSPGIRCHSGPSGNQEPKRLPGGCSWSHPDPCPLPRPTSLWALGAGQQEAKGWTQDSRDPIAGPRGLPVMPAAAGERRAGPTGRDCR